VAVSECTVVQTNKPQPVLEFEDTSNAENLTVQGMDKYVGYGLSAHANGATKNQANRAPISQGQRLWALLVGRTHRRQQVYALEVGRIYEGRLALLVWSIWRRNALIGSCSRVASTSFAFYRVGDLDLSDTSQVLLMYSLVELHSCLAVRRICYMAEPDHLQQQILGRTKLCSSLVS